MFAGGAKTPVASSGDWEFSLSAGPAFRQSGSLGFTGGSRSATTFIPSLVGSNSLEVPPIGDENAYDQRTYNDGFVRTDGSTDVDGYTTNWGYRNAGQVSGDDLSFHATGFQSIRSNSNRIGDAPSTDRRENSIAPIIQFSGKYKEEINGFRPGFTASLMWSPVKMHQEWSDFSLSQVRDDYRHDWTDVYNLGGFGSDIPGAPYTGNAMGPGFVLENIPDSRDLDKVLINTENAELSNRVSTRFNADHTTLSFGPTFGKPIAPGWTMDAGMGVSLHWLHWSASQNEKLTVTKDGKSKVFKEWNDNHSGNRVLGGIYFQLATEWTPKDQDWSIRGLIRGDFGQTFSKQIGPSHVSYDLDGFTAAVMISHPL
jgi:hypothetical protein